LKIQEWFCHGTQRSGGILRLRAPTLGGAGVVFAIEAYLKISF